MQVYKRWIMIVLGGMALFIALNFCIWEMFTKDLLTDNVRSGDYTRVGYITGSNYSVKPDYKVTKRHIESYEYKNEPVDILTLGDSFSNSCGKQGQYYQDIIASLDSLSVLNVQMLPGKKFYETIVTMHNSGLLDRIRPKAVLLQLIERNIIDTLSRDMDMDQQEDMDAVLRSFQSTHYVNKLPRVSFLNIGNFKFVLYTFLRTFKDNAFFSKVYTHDLVKPFFSVRNSQKLIVAYEDIEHLKRENEQSIRKVNDNLNALEKKLRVKGIRLYFMPVVDKYNLYSPYLVNNPYPESSFFEIIAKLPHKYHMIDTKKILSEEVRNGELDVYYADDSHWSWKAPKKIFETLSSKAFWENIRRG